MIQYSKLGEILICGDFNARTANILDFIPFDSNNYVPLYDQYNSDTEIRHRQSQDDKVDNRSKELIDLCIGQNLRILNGRTFGDIFGKITSYTPMDQVLLTTLLYQ